MDLVVGRGLIHHRRHITVGDFGDIGHQVGQPAMHPIDGILHLFVVTLAGDLHTLPQVAPPDQLQHSIPFTNGQEDGIQHVVDAAHHLAIRPLELFRLPSFGKQTILRSQGQALQLLLQSGQDLGDLDQTFRQHIILRTDLHPNRQVACRDAARGVGLLRNGINALVQVVLDLVEVALIRLGNPGRVVPLGDAVHILGSHVQRPDHRIQGVVDPGDDLFEVALVLAGIGPGGEFARHRRLGEHAGVGHQGTDGVDHLLHGRHDTGGIARAQDDLPGEVTNRHQVGQFTDLFRVAAQLAEDDAGNKEGEAKANKDASHHKDGHHPFGAPGLLIIAVVGHFGLDDLRLRQLVQALLFLGSYLPAFTIQ